MKTAIGSLLPEWLFLTERMGRSMRGDKIFQYTDNLLVAIKADIDAFVGGVPQFDDITILCVEYLKAISS